MSGLNQLFSLHPILIFVLEMLFISRYPNPPQNSNGMLDMISDALFSQFSHHCWNSVGCPTSKSKLKDEDLQTSLVYLHWKNKRSIVETWSF